MTAIKKIMAMVDGSIYSASVCDHTAWIAKKSAAAVDIVHVLAQRSGGNEQSNLSGSIGLGARTALLEELVELDSQKAKLSHKLGRAVLDDAKARMSAAGIDAVTTRLRHEEIVETIENSEQDTDLIVIGKRGMAAEHDMLHLGSNLERVVRSSQKPVLVASRAFKPINRLLIAFDGGESVMKAIAYLADSPVFNDINCQLLSVGPASSKGGQRIQQAADSLTAAGLSVTVDTELGQPEEVISQHVETAGIDLLVMGAYGHSHIRSLIIGSTTTSMIQSCKIPVLLFR
ncbi:MAG: nucleotide-binding universal stress UspA family protein [Gammaproteobacteria bacterium]|jgi:nucleotide-binding universal stress UspA family protein